MTKKMGVLLIFSLLAGCSGNTKSDSALGLDSPPDRGANGKVPVFALPGVPMKSEMEADETAKKSEPAAEAPAADPSAAPAALHSAKPLGALPGVPPPAAPAPAKPLEPAVAAPAAPAADSGDLTFHLNAAKKYAAKRRYRSAAAEYEAAVPFLPAGDARAVRLLERQGAMMLKLNKKDKAQGYFEAAVAKAKDLNAPAADGLGEAYLGLGYCQEKAGKAQDAVASYEKAMELSDSKTVKARLADSIAALKKKP
jgi:tetratricopeptide (TPR) repeat protein